MSLISKVVFLHISLSITTLFVNLPLELQKMKTFYHGHLRLNKIVLEKTLNFQVVVNKHPPKAAPVATPTQGESSTADQTSSKEPTRAPVAEPPPETDDFSDFGFSSSSSSSDELGSKINDLVAMVKSKVKKKKKKKRKLSEQESADEDSMVSEPIPKLKIRFGKQKSGSEEVSSSEEASKPTTDSPMKLTIKLGAVGSSPLIPPPPLLPPPPSLTLHKPSPVMSPQPSSPKYEPAAEDSTTVLKFKRCDVESGDEKPPIKLTLRVAQPMRNAKGWISPRTEQLVNYIDDVTTFIGESVELSAKSDIPERSSSEHSPSVSASSASSPAQAPLLPEPPKLKPAPPSPSKRAVNCKSAPLTTKIKLPSTAVTTACRKRKRESSPKHDAAVLTPKEVMEETRKPAVPPLKFRRSCLSNKVVESPGGTPAKVVGRKPRNASASSSDTPTNKGPKSKKKKTVGSVVEEKEFWHCGIFSNTLKQGSRPLANDELDFRSNILPIYCGKQPVRIFVPFRL